MHRNITNLIQKLQQKKGFLEFAFKLSTIILLLYILFSLNSISSDLKKIKRDISNIESEVSNIEGEVSSIQLNID